MVITYYGGAYFKVAFGQTTLSLGPISKDSKLEGPRFGADVSFVPMAHPDFNGAEQNAHGKSEPFVVRGPGEYEVQGVFIKGLPTESSYASVHGGANDLINTMYLIRLEDMDICYLGATSQPDFKSETWEQIGNVDILIVPIGGEENGVTSAEEAYKLGLKLEAHIIIPMLYGAGEGDSENSKALAQFRKEDSKAEAPVEKLTIKKKDLAGREGDIMVITKSAQA